MAPIKSRFGASFRARLRARQVRQATAVTIVALLLAGVGAQTVNVCGEILLLSATSVQRNSEGCSSVPTEIGTLVELTSLNLQGNELSSLPTEIGNLAKLVKLDVANNRLSHVPTEVGRLDRLQELIGADNAISTLPTEIGHLVILRDLLMDINAILEIPTEIGQIAALKRINLGTNRIATVPTQVGNLVSVDLFWLDKNDITVLPTEIGGMPALTSVKLEFNKIATVPTQIGNLVLLEQLILRQNKLTGLPTQIGNLALLQLFLLEANEITSLPTEIGNLVSLYPILTLNSNRLKTLPTEIGNLDNVVDFRVQDNMNSLIVPEEVSSMLDLQYLRLGAIRCDCELFQWYPTFSSVLLARPGAALATCANDTAFQAVNPAQVILNPFAPCTQILPLLENTSALSRSLTLYWKDPSVQDVNPASAFVRSLDTFKALDGTILNAMEAAGKFKDCEQLIAPTTAALQMFGYKIELFQDGSSVLERCGFAEEFGYTIGSTAETVFNATIFGLEPASTYEVSIAALNITANIPAPLEEFLFTLGPVITPYSITTPPDVPEGNVTQIRATFREEDRLSIEWAEPQFPNGEIELYQVQLIGESADETTVTASIDLDGLDADTFYSVRVRAATGAGFGEWSPPFEVKTCPVSMKSTSTTGSCFAKRGFFLDDEGTAPLSCLAYADFIDLGICEQEDVGVMELSVLPGKWRSGSASINFRECPLGESSCVGGSLVALNATLCRPNFEGPLCALCARGFFYNGADCELCEAPRWTSFTPLIMSGCVLVVAFVVLMVVSRRHARLVSAVERGTLKLKVLITTYQIVGTFSWTLGAVFPSVYTFVVNILLFLNFDVTDLFPNMRCIYDSNYLVELLLVTCIPLGCALIPATIYWRSKTKPSEDRDKALRVETRGIQALIVISFLVYTPVSSKIFRALRPCDYFPDLQLSYMPEDYRITCESAEHTAVLGVAVTMLVVYCIGVPAFYALLLWPRRKDIQEQSRLTALRDRRSSKDESELRRLESELEPVLFLYNSYWYWWWELVEVLRKVVLAGMITLVAPGTAEQSILLMLLALASTVLYHHFLPLRDENLLGLVAAYAVFFAAFASLLVKLREDMVKSSFLDLLLVVMVCAPVVVAVVLTEEVWGSITQRWSGCCKPAREGSSSSDSAHGSTSPTLDVREPGKRNSTQEKSIINLQQSI